MPLPRILKRAPACVPAGMCRSSRPLSVGTLMLPPRASVGKLIGSSQKRSSSSRWKNVMLLHVHDDVEVAGRAAGAAVLAFA